MKIDCRVCDICGDCFCKMATMIQHPELIRQFGGDKDELAVEADGEAEDGKTV